MLYTRLAIPFALTVVQRDIKQIERFHELLETIDKQITEKGKDAGSELLEKYFELTSKVWPMVDDCIEQIKHRLDKFERF